MKSVSSYAAATLAAAILALGAGSARADTFMVNAYTGDLGGPFNATKASAALFTAANNSQEATFTYAGPLYFVNTQAQNSAASGDVTAQFFGADAADISGYTDDTAPKAADYGNFATLAGFLAASGSAAGYPYGTLDIFTDISGPIAAGTRLTVTHDDGATFYDNGVAIAGTTAGPTTAVTETVTVPVTGTITLAYARENGTPSILTVSETTVPEPFTMSLLGAGLVGLGVARRSRR